MASRKPKPRTLNPKQAANPFVKLGRKRYHPQTVEKTAEMIRMYYGNLSAVAYAYGITRPAVEEFIKRNAAVLRPVLEESRNIALDTAEFQLMDKVRAGDWKAIELLLETIGRQRGYVKGLALGGMDSSGGITPLAVQVYLPDNGRTPTNGPSPVATPVAPPPADDDEPPPNDTNHLES